MRGSTIQNNLPEGIRWPGTALATENIILIFEI